MFVTGLVLAAGASKRLGRPKQLLPYAGATLLDATLSTARRCEFDQLIVTLGGAAEQVRERVDLAGIEIVDNPAYGVGCSSSIVRALEHVDPRADGLVLLLGDQPGISPASVSALIDAGDPMAIGVCRYHDGRGHPFWFGHGIFGELATIHGDKAVWKLLESRRHHVSEVTVAGDIPLDVDTEQDYDRLLATERSGTTR